MPTEAQRRLGLAPQGLLDEKKFTTNGVRLQADAISRSRTYDRLEQLLHSYDVLLTPTLTAPPLLADRTSVKA